MNICVYGASSNAIDESYIAEIGKLGEQMAQRGHSLVFGAGANGLMGAAARGVYKHGGKIIGVSPKFFDVDGVLFEHCDELIYTDTMRERKQIMEDRADAFIVSPGGFGTFEEFFEILTLKQLARHTKAIVVLNLGGYYDKLEQFVDYAIEQHFVKPECKAIYAMIDNVEDALNYIESYKPTYTDINDMKDIKSSYVYEADVRG